MSILDHPKMQQLEPENGREALLFAKAYLTAIEATIEAARQHGWKAVKELHGKVMAELTEALEGPEPRSARLWRTSVDGSGDGPYTEQIAEANEAEVKRLFEHLLTTFQDYCNNSSKEVEYLDAFMAAHNFHCWLILDIERRIKADPKRQLFLREMAVDTFQRAMENKPAFKQEAEQ